MISLRCPPKPHRNRTAGSLDHGEPEIRFVGLSSSPCIPPEQLAAALRLSQFEFGGRGGPSTIFPTELLSPQDEVGLFRGMNQLKAGAEACRRAAARVPPGSERNRSLRRMRELLSASGRLRNRIVSANVRLVLSTAKKFAPARLDRSELISEGNFTLLQAVEKFDFSRGFRFSTYATWALRYRFQRMAGRTADPLRNRAGDGDSTNMLAAPPAPDPAEIANRRRWVALLDRLLDQLDPREQVVVRGRFGLGEEAAESLNDLARRLGVCKERVRQLQLRGLAKLRGLADAHRIVPPAMDD